MIFVEKTDMRRRKIYRLSYRISFLNDVDNTSLGILATKHIEYSD